LASIDVKHYKINHDTVCIIAKKKFSDTTFFDRSDNACTLIDFGDDDDGGGEINKLSQGEPQQMLFL
jgi:hypothetical protein